MAAEEPGNACGSFVGGTEQKNCQSRAGLPVNQDDAIMLERARQLTALKSRRWKKFGWRTLQGRSVWHQNISQVRKSRKRKLANPRSNTSWSSRPDFPVANTYTRRPPSWRRPNNRSRRGHPADTTGL